MSVPSTALMEWATHGFDDDTGNLVGIGTTGWTPVLEVTFALFGARSWNAHAGTTVRDSPAERIDASGLMLTSKAITIALAIDCDMILVTSFESLHCGFDMLHTTLGTHLGG